MRLIISFLIVLIGFSCNTTTETKQDNFQTSNVSDPSKNLVAGKLIYSVSGQYSDDWEFEVTFDSLNSKIFQKFAFKASEVYIFDKKAKEVLGLICDFALNLKLKDCYVIYYTPDELFRANLSPKYGDTVIKKTQEYKTILGYKCQKSIVRFGSQAKLILWTTDKIKPGIILPWTPLSMQDIALEYELKILGSTDTRYVIKSISESPIPKKEFEHRVPLEYTLLTYFSLSSLDSIPTTKFWEIEYSSVQYPTINGKTESIKKLIKEGLQKIMSEDEIQNIHLEFIVRNNGTLKNIVVNYNNKDAYKNDVVNMLNLLPKWTPGKVRGKPVNSKVEIYF